MSLLRKTTKHRQVLQIKYSYKDLENGEMVTSVDYVKDMHDLIRYFEDIEKEHFIVDTEHYRCREDIIFKINQVYIPEKKYLLTFKD